MDITAKVRDVISSLNEIESRFNEASEELSKTELAINDLYHFIEFNNMDAKARCHVISELKSKLSYRRSLKQELDLIREFNDQKNKLLTQTNRGFIINSLNQKLKSITREYNYRIYKKEELEELVK